MTGQQFNLRWNNHTNNLVQVFADQYEREQMVDVTLTCQGKFLKAHRMVLGACSPYFQDIFDRHDSNPHPIIIMNGFEFEDVQAVVEFMYKGEVMVSESVMPRMLKAAEGLQIKGLSNVRSKREEQSMEEEDEEKSHSVEHCLSGGSDPSLLRRSSEQQQAVPLHKKRKRGRVHSHELQPTTTTATTPQQGNKAKQARSPKSDHLDPTDSRSTDVDEQMDDLLTAINIEPPLLRDIDGSVKTEWDSPLKDESTSPEELMLSPEHKEKIPRPPNSFMIFANEYRRRLANQFPNESNKEISVRLGLMWKGLGEELKAKYFTAAKQANDDHKKKFPNYHYNPKEARLRKMYKMQQQQMGHMVVASGHN